MKLEKVLGQLIIEERISTGLAMSLEWSLDNYLGFLALRRIGKIGKRKQLKDLSFKQFIYLLKFNVLMLYIPGLGVKRMRELRLAVMRYIDDHNLDYEFPHIEEIEKHRRRGLSLIEKCGMYK